MNEYQLTPLELLEMESYDAAIRDLQKQKEGAIRLICRQQGLTDGTVSLEGGKLVMEGKA